MSGRKKNGDDNPPDPSLSERVAILETDMKWVKKILGKIDKRTWWILGSVVVLGLIAIVTALAG